MKSITGCCRGSTNGRPPKSTATNRCTSGAAVTTSPRRPLGEEDPRNPRFDPRYRDVPEAELPRTESLSDTVARIMPYWKCEILPALAHHDAILVVAHGNSLRGIIKHLKGISDEAISEFNLPTAVPYVFEFDEGLNYAGDHFLGDPDEIAG